jgi:polysaccharide biosynthesis protein EpsC
MHTVLLLGLINGSRASYRILKQWGRRASTDGVPILIYGAGVAGTMAVREALSKPDLQIRPIGFIDDDQRLRGRFVNGLPVVGSLETLAEVLTESDAAGVVIATDKLTRERVQEISGICDRAGRWTQYFSIQILSKYDASENSNVVIKTPLMGGAGRLATEPPVA